MSANLYNFKKIPPVPTSKDFLDIVLSKTQRKTPTVVHKGYSIGRIRQFYMRKVKFTHDSMEEKLKIMLDGFPKLENIHPFYADLMNILYDKDHYKLALGQLNTARHLIGTVAKDYVRMMKFGDSLYRCKQLKRAALGRMATIMRRQKESLAYLEQVRQHLARLPSIDPNTRTLLLCGYPNVGKSSFMNKVTRAEVEVQPYAFTTKSLFVGHMDYRYLRWQVLDTPGILDHPLEERNTIEMQSITALAHLRACVLYFLDISEQCGYSIEAQLSLFQSIKPLFANKQLILVISKIDVLRPDQLDPENAERLNQVIQTEGLEIAQLSTYTDEGVMETKQRACEKLLQARVEVKLKGSRINDVLNRLQVAQPMPRDELDRPAFIPEAVKTKQKYDPNDPLRPRLEKDLEVEAGGAGVYNVDLKKKYLLKVPEWKQDAMPEILDGKNVADFIDPDILEKLDTLEREEERLTVEGYYESESEGSEEEEIRELAGKIKNERKLRTLAHHNKQGKNRPVVPAKVMAKRRVAKQKEDDGDGDEDMMEVDAGSSSKEPGPLLKRLGSARKNRSLAGLKSEKLRKLTSKLKKNSQRPSNLLAKRGESDRVILVKKPRHLFSGKRKMGKTDRR